MPYPDPTPFITAFTLDRDFAVVRMGKRWRKGFELVVPVG